MAVRSDGLAAAEWVSLVLEARASAVLEASSSRARRQRNARILRRRVKKAIAAQAHSKTAIAYVAAGRAVVSRVFAASRRERPKGRSIASTPRSFASVIRNDGCSM